MLAQWTGEVVGKMHVHGITAIELAQKLGYNPKYLSAVLNGKRTPKNAESRFLKAIDELIAEKSDPEDEIFKAS